ncbi:oligosaccharide flippase family protein [Ferruginibacter paludis]|uniref:oligosaccharide flippase family protein n=1 Tax=Ferruginibacter paludis TaxID=1310417 RepID=UPI0025B306B7|nr:oligosaccharide flippase family protein [Ferruginibacter paludis]MDN3658990.1 oligosaccharide flippase family protein [Ferruginibacter paludis]
MSNIKKLASQTMWYGLSSIAARLINYLLTPYLTYSENIKTSDFGKMALIYAALPILNILFTYGFETAYFRFSSKEENKDTIYNTAFLSLLSSTIVFTALLWFNQASFGNIIGLGNYPQIVQLGIFIIAFDTLSTIPFARLRQQGRPMKFAFVKITGILINIFFTWFFISYCSHAVKQDPNSWISIIYDTSINPIVYVVLANLIQSVVTLLFLSTEIAAIRFKFDTRLWKEMMVYSLPLIIVGMGGMVNETFDRLMLKWWLPGDALANDTQVGIYSACYKLSILITLFIQAFRMGAEPFFFKQAEGQNPQRVFARVMKFFVIIISLMFLAVSLFMPIWKNFIGPKYWDGLSVVPILLLANMFIGIYYNLSVWYKLGNKTSAGAWITVGGALLTTIINYLFIPKYGYMACAWATFFCYGSMMVASFIWGQKEYRIPYAWKKLVAYIVIVVLLFFAHKGITAVWNNKFFSLTIATILTGCYMWFIGTVEKKELPQLPVVGKYFKK